MSENSKRGDPREHQVEAFTTGRYKKEVDVPEKRFLGMVVRRAGKETVEAWGTHSTLDGAVFPDDVEVTRKFKHRCGLIKAVNVLSGSKSTMTLYLDGFHNVILGVENTEFKFDPQLENGPVADILYEEDCTRRGKMKSGRQDVFAAMIFKDQNQMREFVIATTTAPDPEQKTEYHARHVHHGSSDSVSSVWPLAAGVLLGVAISGD